MKTKTPAGWLARRIDAPRVSMSRIASWPAAKYSSKTARDVPYRLPCTSAHSANSPRSTMARKVGSSTKW